MNIQELFEKHSDEYLKFERVERKLTRRPDLHAFMVLDNLFPRDSDLVSAAERDEIFLDVEAEEIETLTEAMVIELIRCGVRYDSEFDCLAMFV
jgi:hypothetical protein